MAKTLALSPPRVSRQRALSTSRPPDQPSAPPAYWAPRTTTQTHRQTPSHSEYVRRSAPPAYRSHLDGPVWCVLPDAAGPCQCRRQLCRYPCLYSRAGGSSYQKVPLHLLLLRVPTRAAWTSPCPPYERRIPDRPSGRRPK